MTSDRTKHQKFARDVIRQRSELVQIIQARFLKWVGLVPAVRWDEAGPAITLALGGRRAVLMPRSSMSLDWPENSLYPTFVAQLVAVLTVGQPLAACKRWPPAC